MQSIKLITWDASERVARYAFHYAQSSGRNRVTAVHKANIMKMSDGMFLAACREVSKDFPNVQYDEDLLDRACLQVRSLAAYAKFEKVSMTSPIDRPKSEAVRGPRDGDAQLVR